MSDSFASVLLDTPLETPLDYKVPEDLSLEVGMRVEVPLRNRTASGTVLALKNTSPYRQAKHVVRPLSERPLLSDHLLKLAFWISYYYCSPLEKIVKAFLPPPVRNKGKHKVQRFVKPQTSQENLRLLCENLRVAHPAQAKVLELLLRSPKGLFLSEIFQSAGISESPVRTLEKKGIVRCQKIQVDRSPNFFCEYFPTKKKELNQEQKMAKKEIGKTLGSFQTHLLYGVTGSGKTEVYLQLIEMALQQGFQTLYLIPEISLAAQTIECFKGRFEKRKIALLHHRLSEGERFDTWHKIHKGEIDIVIGARSAVFSPLSNLGLIIVDEEHESAYKQSDETPKYHGRDVAVMRGKLESCPVVLGTATPSIESYHNARIGKYQLHHLHKRAIHSPLPQVTLVDMSQEYEKNKGFTLFSRPLISALIDRFKKGEQSLIFLNRRGYHTAAVCVRCSSPIRCPHCELSLTYHRGEKILSCHLCDHRTPPKKACPSCQKEGTLKYKGVGTEMVERSLHALIPEIRSLRLDADTTKHKGSYEKIFKEFRSGKADVLIGTQMVAKGFHFPLITLVGVLNVDGALNIPDFRASEGVFQLLTQVAGRAGREQIPGEVIIQTQLQEHSVIQHATEQDFSAFYQEEIESRKMLNFPPFIHLVKCSFSQKKEAECLKNANDFRALLIPQLPQSIEILPVIPCGYAKIAGLYRFQFLIKGKEMGKILKRLAPLRLQFNRSYRTRLSIDVDPLSTFF